MADAYGTLTFCASDDAIFNKKKLLDVVNQYQWDNDDGVWEDIDESENYITRDSSYSQYPSICAWGMTYCGEYTDHKSIALDRNLYINDEEFNCAMKKYELMKCFSSDEEYLDYERNRLIGLIADTISLGWVEFAAIAAEKSRYITFESIRINHAREAVIKTFISGAWSGSKSYEEKITLK